MSFHQASPSVSIQCRTRVASFTEGASCCASCPPGRAEWQAGHAGPALRGRRAAADDGGSCWPACCPSAGGSLKPPQHAFTARELGPLPPPPPSPPALQPRHALAACTERRYCPTARPSAPEAF
eukprot:1810922-Prymnesium_polylepis.1